VLHAQARAHWGRYLHGSRADGKQVRALAKRCLLLRPDHQPSFTLLKQMDARPRRGRRLAIAAAIVALGGIGLGAWRLAGRGPGAAAQLCGGNDSSCHVPVPVAFRGTGFEVAFAPAVLEVSADALRLRLAGKLTHRGATELDELRLTAHLLDDAGKELGTLRFDAHPSFDPPLRSGDSSAFFVSDKVPPGTRHVEVTPGQVHATRAPELYGTSTPVEVHGDLPEHVVLRAAYRKRQVHAFTDKTSVEGVLEVENGGPGAIRALELELRALAPDGSAVGEAAKETVAYGHMPPMEPGERRAVRFHLYVPGTVAAERLTVTKVE
jgi:hypothetical protein